MPAASPPPRDAVPLMRAPSWVFGGALLVASVLLPLVLGTGTPLVGGGTLGGVLFAGALVAFAVGVRGDGAVAAGRALGTWTLVAWGLAALAVPVVATMLTPVLADPAAGVPFGMATTLLLFVLGLLATTQIALSGVVPTPWHRGPLIALLAVAASWVITQVAAVLAPTMYGVIAGATTLQALVLAAAMTVVGIAAIALGAQPAEREASQA